MNPKTDQDSTDEEYETETEIEVFIPPTLIPKPLGKCEKDCRKILREIATAEAKSKPLTPPDLPRNDYIDFNGIDERLGFSEPGESESESEVEKMESDFGAAGNALGEVIQWLIEPHSKDATFARVTALAYCLRPEAYDSKTACEVAASIGLTKSAFGQYHRLIREKFGLKTLYCKSEAGIEKYRKIRTGKKTWEGNGKLERRHREWQAATTPEEKAAIEEASLAEHRNKQQAAATPEEKAEIEASLSE